MGSHGSLCYASRTNVTRMTFYVISRGYVLDPMF
jgi:hypothetical protein